MTFRKGQSGNPAGKLKGTKDHFPRSGKRAIAGLLERFGSDTCTLGKTLRTGLSAKAPASFPYLRLVVEQALGAPDQSVTVRVPKVMFKEYDR